MDIALIIGVIFGFVCMIGSIAYALFVEGSAAVSYTHLRAHET